jgi:hypothetical protein
VGEEREERKEDRGRIEYRKGFPPHNATYRLGDVNFSMHNSADFLFFLFLSKPQFVDASEAILYSIVSDSLLIERA